MLVETFINPLNLPNLLTPFRYNLEIQYIIFAILFVSLLGYVLFIFLDYINSLDKILILLAVFVVLLFLYLVIKERDRLDELSLQEEAVDMAEELAKIERDVQMKKFFKDEAKKGIIYDENDNRIETGKADTGKVTNLRSEINKLETRKKEILEKQKNFDSTFLQEAKDQVKSSAESEMNHLTKRSKNLEKKIELVSGITTEKLNRLIQEKDDLEDQITLVRDSSAKGDKNPKVIELRKKLDKKKLQIQREEANMDTLEITARDRVEIDRARRELEEIRQSKKKVEGLYGDKNVEKRDINIFKKNELYKAEEKFEKLKEIYKQAKNKERTDNNAKNQDASKKAFDELKKARRELGNLEENRDYDSVNRGLGTAERLINTYDQSTDIGNKEYNSKQVGVYQKLNKLDEDATEASKLSRTAADLATSLNGSEEQRVDALVRTVRDNLPKGSYITDDEIRSEIEKGKTDEAKFVHAGAVVKAQEKIVRGVSADKAKEASLVEVTNSMNLSFNSGGNLGPGNNQTKVASALLEEISGGRISTIDSRNLILTEEKLNRGRERAERETYNLIFDKDKQKVKDSLGNQIYTSDSDGNKRMKDKFVAVKNNMANNYLENIETFQRIVADGSVPGKFDPNGYPKECQVPKKDGRGYIGINKTFGQRCPEKEDELDVEFPKNFNGINLDDFKDLVYQLSSQLKENPDVNTGYFERNKLKNVLDTQKEWLEQHGI